MCPSIVRCCFRFAAQDNDMVLAQRMSNSYDFFLSHAFWSQTTYVSIPGTKKSDFE